MPGKILVVDDDEDVRGSLERLLGRHGYETLGVDSGEAAISKLQSVAVDVVILDVNLPGKDGIATLQALRARGDRTPVVVMSGQGTIDVAMRAIRQGASDFVEKPARSERLLTSLSNAMRISALESRVEAAAAGAEADAEIVGQSAPIVRLRQLIAKAAPSEARVLITGENGTGKELVAHAIHTGSPRRDRPFVKLNSAAVPAELIESELFGHEKGSFTGAVAQRKGKFELANRGTLFLDEVGDMPLAMQAKLLRVLQEGEIEPIGAERARPVDVRVIAATNRDLLAMVGEGRFREDLYYRLAVVMIESPPLRDRRTDIPLLVQRFAQQLQAQALAPVAEFSAQALERMSAHDFPGNVRELRNLVERLLVLGEGPIIRASDVDALIGASGKIRGASTVFRPGLQLKAQLEALERQILEEALIEYGTMASAARALGLERSHLYKRFRALGLRE